MSDSASPHAPPPQDEIAGVAEVKEEDEHMVNGHVESVADASEDVTAPAMAAAKGEDVEMADAAAETNASSQQLPNGDSHDDAAAESEAETLIESPVKRREAEKTGAVVKSEKVARNRIGSLPVPGEDDEDTSTPASPVQSVEDRRSNLGAQSSTQLNNHAMRDAIKNDTHESSSDALSSPRSPDSDAMSRTSSQSRAHSMQSAESSISRKRKHRRASSTTVPNKRRSMDPPKRGARGATTDDLAESGRSSSPKLRSHRRAISTQSAVVDSNGDRGNQKRREASQVPSRETKTNKAGWDESDASSETASHGHVDTKRPARGIGRSTSTPGRHVGREHKRHINKYGFTRLAEACESGDLEAVKEWLEKDPDQLELAEFAQNKPLQIAALNGNDEIVSYLIEQGCQIDCANVDLDTPLIDAAENGHLNTVKILLKAGVNPLRQNKKGDKAFEVVTDKVDDADAIRAVIREAIKTWESNSVAQQTIEEEQRHQGGTSKGLHFMARSYENLLKLVTHNDRSGVREFLDARVPVDNAVVAAAAKTGDIYLVNMLLAEMNEKKAYQRAEKPMLAVLGTSHLAMVKALTELDQFNPLYKSRSGKTWPEIAEDKNGPNAREEKELLLRLLENATARQARRSSSPVVKRDSTTRRSNHQDGTDSADEDEDEDEDAPQRRNGRRLLSRRAMRAAGGKSASDSGTDASASEADATSEAVKDDVQMRPPASPTTRRASVAGRPRTKSMSAQPPESSPRTRRQSLSARDAIEKAMPIVVEKPVSEGAATADCAQAEDAARKTREEEDKLETERREQEQAETEARAAQEAARVAHEEETRRIEEINRAAEAEKVRQAEAAREAEETKKAEEDARKVQDELRQKEAAQIRDRLREDVLESLPPCLASMLRDDSSYKYRGVGDLQYALNRYIPIYLVKSSEPSTMHQRDLSEADAWVVNTQAAALLGKRGLELLYHHDALGSVKIFSQNWNTYSVFSAREQRSVDWVLDDMVNVGRRNAVIYEQKSDDEPKVSFEEECAQNAAAYNAEMASRRKLREGPAAVYCVRLADVLANLDPLFHTAPLKVVCLDRMNQPSAAINSLNNSRPREFVLRYSNGAWRDSRAMTSLPNGTAPATTAPSHGFTTVRVVHQK